MVRGILDKNRRGDIPVTILAVGTLIVCTLAIITFIFYESRMDKLFDCAKFIEEANGIIEKEEVIYP